MNGNCANAVSGTQPRRRRVRRSQAVLLLGRLEAPESDDICLVSDISPIGARVQTAQPLAPGERVMLELGEVTHIPARVCWVANGSAGLEFAGMVDLEPVFVHPEAGQGDAGGPAGEATRRAYPRIRRCGAVRIFHQGHASTGNLVNVSPGGGCVALDGDSLLRAGDWVGIAVAGMPEREATIRWADDNRIGFSFDCPMPLWKLDRWLVSETEKCAQCTADACSAPSFNLSLTKRRA